MESLNIKVETKNIERRFNHIVFTLLLTILISFHHAAYAQMEFNRSGHTGSVYSKPNNNSITFQAEDNDLCHMAFNGRISCVAGIQIDNDTACNDVTDAGTIRYQSSIVQLCDGTSWIAFNNQLDFTGPDDCPSIGDQCDDNTIYAGRHPVLFNRIYVHPNNQSTDSRWNTAAEDDDTGADSLYDGRANQEDIVTNEIIANYPAFKDCDDLNQASALGHTDWYLGSQIEMYYLAQIKTELTSGPGDSFVGTGYWTSTETSNTQAWYQHMSGTYSITGGPNNKTGLLDVRCMRRDN